MGQYTKVVFEGSTAAMRAFLAGWSQGKGMASDDLRRRVLWPDNWSIKTESILKGIVGAIKPGREVAVLLSDEIVDEVITALEPWAEKLELELRGRHRVHAAFFQFEFKIFARDQAAVVRNIFESLPDGVTVSTDYKPEERSDPSATGSEMYAPAHDYECRGKGTIAGNVRGVLEVHLRAHRHERIKTSDVELRLES